MSIQTIPLPFPAHGDDYVLFPACAYDGNRFPVLDKKYPPMFTPEEGKQAGGKPFITPVPRLGEDSSGILEVTAGDVSVPCIGVFSRAERKAVLLFTLQEIDRQNIGLAYERGQMILTHPARRREVYTMCTMTPQTEAWIPSGKEIPYKLLSFDCETMEQFFRVFFENRKCMGLDDTLPEVPSKEEQFEIQKNKFNAMNWRETEYGGFYAVGTTDNKFQVWQPGWTGGAMGTYAFLKCGGTIEKERSVKTLHHLFRTQGASGLFWGICDKDGAFHSDGFGVPGTEKWTLIRKSADVLYFVLRQFELLEEIPAEFENGIRRCADAFVRLCQENGQLGQFADVETGEITVSGSTSGGIAPAGLALAYRYFGDSVYLETAQALADHFYTHIQNGYTTGGPGEMLQCPDSESAFGVLESFVWLYEITGKEKYLSYARAAADFCSSWVVPYNYRFPETSEFGRLGIKSVGSVFANAQNKHSAPGICSLSGTSVYKVYKWTGDERYLTLYREITETVGQYMSTEARPIRALDGSILPPGFICERVNLSDWESAAWVGNVFNGSCWCEVSNLLWLAGM